MKTDSAVALKQLNTQSVTVRSRTAAQKLTYLQELVYQAPQVEPIYISGQSQRWEDGQTKILSGQLLREAQRHFNLIPRTEPKKQVCYHPSFSPRLVSIREDRELTQSTIGNPVKTQEMEKVEERRVSQEGKNPPQMTPQERKQYEWYVRKYENADMSRDPEKERERISMIMAALFPHHSHMPPERNERKVGRKKGLQGETPGESRDEIKARTAAQKIEQQEQRAKAQQRALMHAAPTNVHHMSTRQKAQTKTEASVTQRTPSPSQSSSSESSTSSSTSSSPGKGKDDELKEREVPEEQSMAPEPSPQDARQELEEQSAPSDPSPQHQQPVKEPSTFYKLAKRLSRKTPAAEALTSVPLPKEAQESREMPPPDIPTPRQVEAPPIEQPTGHVSGASSYASIEEPDEGELPSTKRRRSWASLTSSAGSEDERTRGSLDDLQSHDPRPTFDSEGRMGTKFGYSNHG